MTGDQVPTGPADAPDAQQFSQRLRAMMGPLHGPWTWQKIAASPLLVAVRLYQLLVSPLTPPSCRFYPSCSAYAVTALVRFGPIRGSWLALRRIGRCHPWNPGGVDHVPEQVSGRAAARSHAHHT